MARKMIEGFDAVKSLRQMKKLLPLFKELYEGPVVGVSYGYIHIEEEYMTQFAPIDAWAFSHRKDSKYPIEARTNVNGIELIAIMTYEECEERFGIKLYQFDMEV